MKLYLRPLHLLPTENLLAPSLGEARDISLDFSSPAESIGHSLYDRMSITFDTPFAGDLAELNNVLFGVEPTPHFTPELASAIKVCEIFSNS